MTPSQLERHKELILRSKNLGAASDLYLRAAQGLESNEPEDEGYHHIKSAKELIQNSFPELFQVHHSTPRYVIKEEKDYKVLKIGAIAAIVLGIIYAFVAFGPTGDLSKTWTTDDVAKSTAYPKQSN